MVKFSMSDIWTKQNSEQPETVKLEMLNNRPVYHLMISKHWQSIWADNRQKVLVDQALMSASIKTFHPDAQITDGNGKYIVSCIPKGIYTVKVSGVDSKSKPTSPVELSSFVLNATRLDADFGFDMSSVLGFELDRPDAEAAPAVAFTGSSTISMLRTISWLLALGGAIVLVATRRRRHDSSARPAA